VTTIRVVGVALLRPPREPHELLAARRADGNGADGWELPGGKCEPGEDLEAAAVREVREELGCEIRVAGRLDRVQEIRPGLTLEVVVADITAGEPRALEHAELRWLAADELDTVGWLPADVGFVAELRTRLARGVGPPT
jgi:8-oxo-dGTP diphosphatase